MGPEGFNFRPPLSDTLTFIGSPDVPKDIISQSDEPDFNYSAYYCINLWGISTAPQDYASAMCDARITSKAKDSSLHDKVPDDVKKRDTLPGGPIVSKANLLLYNEKPNWYYLSNMTVDEILAFKLYDSTRRLGGQCPLTAFYNNSQAHLPESVSKPGAWYIASDFECGEYGGKKKPPSRWVYQHFISKQGLNIFLLAAQISPREWGFGVGIAHYRKM